MSFKPCSSYSIISLMSWSRLRGCREEARSRNAVEPDIEHEQPVLQQEVVQSSNMPSRIRLTDAEIALGFHPEHSRRNQLVGPAQHVLLEPLDVDGSSTRSWAIP